jgi:vacuolar-type H+-ATPase subunit I/STV1
MTVKPIIAALLVAASACGTSAETERKLADLEQASAQRDSLLQEVAVSARLLNDVSSALSKVQVRGRQIRTSSETPLLAQRDSMMQKLRYVVARVSETETRLTQAQNKIKGLTSLSDSLRATLDSTTANLGAIIESQKSTIVTLTESVTRLEAENVALRDTVATVTERENTVYYVIGTKDQLKEKGIIVEEGGSRVLFVLWRTGSTVSPARNLDPSQFIAINKRDVRQINLDAQAQYRIASRQDLEFLATPRTDKGEIVGASSLEISAPEQFWRNSKFLIIVQQGQSTGGTGTATRSE